MESSPGEAQRTPGNVAVKDFSPVGAWRMQDEANRHSGDLPEVDQNKPDPAGDMLACGFNHGHLQHRLHAEKRE